MWEEKQVEIKAKANSELEIGGVRTKASISKSILRFSKTFYFVLFIINLS